MSRPQVQQARSRHHSHVATSFPANQNRPGRDLKNGVATPVSMGQLEPCRDINRCRDITQATPGRDTKTRSRPSWRLHCLDINFMSRPRFRPQWDFQVATPKSISRPPTLPPMSRHQIHVATPFPPSQSRPGCDATSWSRPHAAPQGFLHVATKANQSQPQPNQVATSNLGRDLKPGSRPNTGIWQ